MKHIKREVQSFFYGQAFADGFRASFAILTPALIGSMLGHFETGITISLGAMCVSLPDAPGPLRHKVNGMLVSAGLAFAVALLTAVCRTSMWLMSIEIAVLTFFFSMFTVYGNRATGIGNAAILVMILTMDRTATGAEAFLEAVYILSGGLFYLLISFISYSIRPYRNAQRILGECIREVSKYLAVRADFYNPAISLDDNYKKLLAQQVTVNEKQDAVREILFKTRQIVRESTNEGRKLVFTFVETVDLFEDITASYYDYSRLREQFGSSGALIVIHRSLQKIVNELDRIGVAIQTGAGFARSFDYDLEVRQLKADIDEALQNEASNKLVLRKIVVNVRNLLTGLSHIQEYFDRGFKRKKTGVDHSHFITHQSFDPSLFINNLIPDSSVFRHAIRVSVACTVAFLLARFIAYGAHGYWILLTVAFILRPAFGLSKQRNIERITGTLAGGAIGLLILFLVPDKTAKFIVMVVFMISTYSFMRLNYLVMVICMTPYVLILFSLFGYGFKDVIQERVIDTLLGCALAFLASYLLFPKWEAEQLRDHMKGILKANAGYLQKIVEALAGNRFDLLEYKLVRKEVYLNSANLSAAFQRMLSEPRSTHGSASQVHQFVVLNHILFSNIATIATTVMSNDKRTYPHDFVQTAKKALQRIKEASKKLGGELDLPAVQVQQQPPPTQVEILSKDDQLMKEQLEFIQTLGYDIEKTAGAISS